MSCSRRTRDVLRFIRNQPCRHASTSSNPYPFPTHPNPQPHQIFHLPRSATQKQVKERYYDLVRIYHPDSPVAREYPADIVHARFQSISKAYDLLRGKSAITGEDVTHRERRADPARFRPRPTRRSHFDETAGDERWKERILFGATLLAIAGFVAQTTLARHNAIAQAAAHAPRPRAPEPKHALTEDALAEPSESTRS